MAKIISNVEGLHDQWLNHYISPGNVGSVGDVLMDVRLKQSAPEMDMRYLPLTHGKKEARFGSNVQNGTISNFFGSGPANTIDYNWNVNRGKRYKIGFRFEDLQPNDKNPSMQMYQGGTPQYSWRNTTSSVYKALHTGAMFLPAPGPFQQDPNTVPRGGSIPSIIDQAGNPNQLAVLNENVVVKALNATTASNTALQSYLGALGEAGKMSAPVSSPVAATPVYTSAATSYMGALANAGIKY